MDTPVDRDEHTPGLPGDLPSPRALDRREALTLLRQEGYGRVIHTRHALPAVTLSPYLVDDDDAVVLPVASESPLWPLDGVVVAFEADQLDDHHPSPTGWAVVVLGHAFLVTERAEVGRLSAATPLEQRSADDPTAYLRIEAEVIKGSRLGG